MRSRRSSSATSCSAKDPERNQEIEHVQQIIRNCADAGIPAVKYNMSMLGVLRGRPARGRGGSRYSNFVWKEVKRDGPLTIAGELDEKTVWDRITYFLERVVPVAEKCGVRMACHPHDPGLPPGEKHRGLPRVLGNVDGLKKFVEIAPSKYHGLNFCQGTIGEMLVNPREEIYDVIRYFGTRGKIFNVHFRNIQGGYLDFRESFIDDGHMNMIECLARLSRSGLRRNDHARPCAGSARGQRRSGSVRVCLRLYQGGDSAGDGRGGVRRSWPLRPTLQQSARTFSELR